MVINKIRDRIANLTGKIGIYYMDLTTKESCFVGNNDVFVSSGISKIMVLIEVFNQIDINKINKHDKYILNKNNILTYRKQSTDATYGALDYLHDGIELTIEDLYKLMSSVSDNLAFNILLDILGIDNVNKTFEKLGFLYENINRYFFDYDKINSGVNNFHSVQEMGRLFYRLYEGQIISNKASDEILNVLKYHQRTNIIPYYFEENLQIAHQTGTDKGIIHDMGIIYAQNPFILCLSANDVEVRKVESALRDVAYICYKNSVNKKED